MLSKSRLGDILLKVVPKRSPSGIWGGGSGAGVAHVLRSISLRYLMSGILLGHPRVTQEESYRAAAPLREPRTWSGKGCQEEVVTPYTCQTGFSQLRLSTIHVLSGKQALASLSKSPCASVFLVVAQGG